MDLLETLEETKPPSPVPSDQSNTGIMGDPEPVVARFGYPVRDSKYYIDEQMSVFLVDNHLFRVHRHFLRRESAVFDSMFSCPPPAEGQEGQSDESPIVLPDVSRSEFVALMDYFYQGSFFLNQPGHTTPLQEYIDLLSIASRFECTGARQKAIHGIESHSVDPLRKLVLSEKYDVEQWLMPAYVELCKRDKPLTKDEAVEIGLDKVLMIAAARESVRSSAETQQLVYHNYYNSGSQTWPTSTIFAQARVERIVNELLIASKLPSIPPTSSMRGGKKKKK